MLIWIIAILLSTLILLILGISKLPKDGEPNYSTKKRILLWTALIIHIVFSLAFIAVFISAIFNTAASV